MRRFAQVGLLGVLLWLSGRRAGAQDADAGTRSDPAGEGAPALETLPSAGAAPSELAPEGVAAPPPNAVEPAEESAQPSSAALSSDELSALGLDLEGPRVDTDFHFWGFADFTSVVPIKPRGPTSAALPRYQSFYIGNVNLYLSKNLTESFRTMGEVRLSYLPNGALSQNASGFGYDSTRALDYANDFQVTRWGGIILERIYLEWTLHRFVTVRGGQFLTPYGIWNVDHGSPAYIPVQRPYAINSQFFPERQTGLELFGRWEANNQSTLGYHLTLSNGAGPISEYRDLDKNKAVGGRLYWEYYGLGYLRVGASGYYGRQTAASPTASLTATEVKVGQAITEQYDELSLAADVLFKLRGWHAQGEWVSDQRRYTPAGRVSHDLILAPVSKAASADSLSWSGYGLLAHQFSWFALTPYVMGQYTRQVGASLLGDVKLRTRMVHVGVNVHPNDAVTFKLEYSHSGFPSGGPFFKYPINSLQMQAAWAF